MSTLSSSSVSPSALQKIVFIKKVQLFAVSHRVHSLHDLLGLGCVNSAWNESFYNYGALEEILRRSDVIRYVLPFQLEDARWKRRQVEASDAGSDLDGAKNSDAKNKLDALPLKEISNIDNGVVINSSSEPVLTIPLSHALLARACIDPRLFRLIFEVFFPLPKNQSLLRNSSHNNMKNDDPIVCPETNIYLLHAVRTLDERSYLAGKMDHETWMTRTPLMISLLYQNDVVSDYFLFDRGWKSIENAVKSRNENDDQFESNDDGNFLQFFRQKQPDDPLRPPIIFDLLCENRKREAVKVLKHCKAVAEILIQAKNNAENEGKETNIEQLLFEMPVYDPTLEWMHSKQSLRDELERERKKFDDRLVSHFSPELKHLIDFWYGSHCFVMEPNGSVKLNFPVGCLGAVLSKLFERSSKNNDGASCSSSTTSSLPTTKTATATPAEDDMSNQNSSNNNVNSYFIDEGEEETIIIEFLEILFKFFKIHPEVRELATKRTILQNAGYFGRLRVVKYLVEEIGCDVLATRRYQSLTMSTVEVICNSSVGNEKIAPVVEYVRFKANEKSERK